MGYRTRPQYEAASGINKRSIVDLEAGRVVGELILESVGRFLAGWTEETPWTILEGGPIPEATAGRTRPEPAVDSRVSPVITHSPNDPEFWVALRDEVPAATFDQLWRLYQEKKAAQRRRPAPGPPRGWESVTGK
jgi:hypothetical protein